jgi:hypothetical protein
MLNMTKQTSGSATASFPLASLSPAAQASSTATNDNTAGAAACTRRTVPVRLSGVGAVPAQLRTRQQLRQQDRQRRARDKWCRKAGESRSRQRVHVRARRRRQEGREELWAVPAQSGRQGHAPRHLRRARLHRLQVEAG